jgi:hypothetical protein
MELAAIFGVLLVIFVIAPLVTSFLLLRKLARSNRISPSIPTLAPTTWLVVPERPARLHRRLRRSVGMANAAAAPHASKKGRATSTIPDLVDDLQRRACLVDNELVVAARAKGPLRWSMLNELERQIDEVEALATRIAGLSSAWAASPIPAGLEAINDRLTAMETAMHEVTAISMNHPSWQPPVPRLRAVEGERVD